MVIRLRVARRKGRWILDHDDEARPDARSSAGKVNVTPALKCTPAKIDRLRADVLQLDVLEFFLVERAARRRGRRMVHDLGDPQRIGRPWVGGVLVIVIVSLPIRSPWKS